MTAVRFATTFLLGAHVALLGCGSKEPQSGSDAGLPPGALLPLKTGNSWTYRVTDAMGVVTMKTQTVMEQELVGGNGPHKDVMAFKMVTRKHLATGTVDETDSWQLQVGTQIVRYRELAYHSITGLLEQEEYWQPAKLRVDEAPVHTRQGASWLEIYQETKLPVGGVATTVEQRDLWTVASAAQSVTVPEGTFDAILLQKVAGTLKQYWFVPGVGKVKETGDQIEELVSHQVTQVTP